jgi:hypothetical protein
LFSEKDDTMSGILWVLIVGLVAGIIARLLSPGPNNVGGFILTTVLGIAGAFLATFIGLLRSRSRRRLYHRDDWRARGAIHLEQARGQPRDFRSRLQVETRP